MMSLYIFFKLSVSFPGHYIHVDTNKTFAGEKGRISKTYENLSPNGNCLYFWYHMWGQTMGILRVYINPPADMSKAKAVWSLDGQQGDFWAEGRTPIGNTSTAVVRG